MKFHVEVQTQVKMASCELSELVTNLSSHVRRDTNKKGNFDCIIKFTKLIKFI